MNRQLTERELDVLTELAKGASIQGAGRALGISGQTVKNHATHIYRAVDNASGLQQALYRLGWTQIPTEAERQVDATLSTLRTARDQIDEAIRLAEGEETRRVRVTAA